MTTPHQGNEHEAVGAYALGILDPADAARFEEHLAYCPACAAQLEEFMGLEPMLATLARTPGGAPLPDPAAVFAAPPPVPPQRVGMVDRLMDEVGAARHKRRRRGLYMVAASAALIVSGPVAATVVASEDKPPVAAQSPKTSSTSQPESALLASLDDQAHAVDPVTKVDVTVGLRSKQWGTEAVMKLKNVKGPLKCRLVAVSKSGEEETVNTWSVPEQGYGIANSENENARKPLYTQGGAAMSRNDIDHFEVRTSQGKSLVSVGV